MIRWFTLVLLPAVLFADISEKQLKTLQIVRDVARTIPDYKGETYENTLSAICLTESSAGLHILGDFENGVNITKASLGPLQIQVQTARHIAKLTPSLHYLLKYSNKRLASLLITDVKTSAKIAAHILKRFSKSRKKYFYMVSGYNGGWRNRPYFKRVMKNYRYVMKLVKQGKLR